VAALSDLILHAGEARRQTVALRAESARVRSESAVMRGVQLERMRICDETLSRMARNRERLPEWPAWGLPTDEILTLVPLA